MIVAMRIPNPRAAWLVAIVLVPVAVAIPLASPLAIPIANAYVPDDADDRPLPPAAEVVLQAQPTAVPDQPQPAPGEAQQGDPSTDHGLCAGPNPPQRCPAGGNPGTGGGQAAPDNPAARDLAIAQANLDQARDERLAAVKDLADEIVAQAYAATAQTPERQRINDGITGAEGNIKDANQDIKALTSQVAALQAELDGLDGEARQAKEVELALAQADLASAQAAKAQGGADKANGRVSGSVPDNRMRDQAVLTAALAGSPGLDAANQAVDQAEHRYELARLDLASYTVDRALLDIVMPDALAGWVLDTAWVPVRAGHRVSYMVSYMVSAGAQELGLTDP